MFRHNLIVLPLLYVLAALPLGFLFKRAGEPLWKAWVPFVSSYTRTKITFGKDRAWWFLIDFVLGGLFSVYRAYNEAKAFGRTSVFAVCHALFEPITTWIMWLSDDDYEGERPFLLDN